MYQTAATNLLIVVLLAQGLSAWAQSPSATYEVQINGESFLVEGNRAVRLASKEKPGLSYDVAIRVSPTQRIRLNTIQLDYELPAKVEENGKRENRSLRLTHELGFSVLLTDLGQPLEPKAQEATLKMLVETVTGTLKDANATGIEIGEPHHRRFGGSAARGVTVRYRDAKELGHVYLMYLLTGTTFTASCVAEYLDQDSDDVLPLIKKTLDSVRAVASRR